MVVFSYFKAGAIVESQPEPLKEISFADYIAELKSGVLEAFTAFVQTQEYGSDAYKNAKKALPFITPHGVFKRKHNSGILKRSGIFCFDVDLKDNPGIDIEDLKTRLQKNPYCIGYHSSPSGGLSFYILTDADTEKWDNHTKEYQSIFEECQKLYEVKLDTAQKALSQARYCSHDPKAYHNPKAKRKEIIIREKITTTPEPITPAGEAEQIIISIINHLKTSGQSLTTEYNQWVGVGFSIGNSIPSPRARVLFHEISSLDSVYDFDEADKVYDGIQKSIDEGTTNKRTIASLIRDAQNIGYVLPPGLKRNEPPKPESKETTKKGSAIESFLEYAADLDIMRNEITQLLELDGEQMKDQHFHTIWMDCHMTKGINISTDEIHKILDSDITPTYNPIIEYLKNTKYKADQESNIVKLVKSIRQDTYEQSFFLILIQKWIVGVVAGAHPFEKNVLQLVLSGEQNTGKTEFFRRLMPPFLHRYYAENKLDDGKDSEILMTQKLIIMDDEYGGKSKFEAKRLKELSSKVEVTVRLPYAKSPVTMQRISSLCGTTNDPEILGDTTGNRRVIPVNVISRDFKAFDQIDKAQLWAEAYHLYKSGFNYELSKDEIKALEPATVGFNRFSSEYELLNKYYDLPDVGAPESSITELTATDILVFLQETTKLNKLSVVNVGKELSRLGFKKYAKRVNGKVIKYYRVRKKY